MMSGLDQQSELARLKDGTCADRPLVGLDQFEIDVACQSDAATVLERVREVLQIVVRQDLDHWSSLSQWSVLLPPWFVRVSAPEQTKQEAEQWLTWWRGLSPEEQETELKCQRWSIGEFVHWFQPPKREWWWWGADVLSADRLRICLAVEELTSFHEALDWLLRTAGAIHVVDENLRDLHE